MAELQRVKASTIRRILAGDAAPLEPIYWRSTPQGYWFWYEEMGRYADGEDLSPEARAYLENLLTNGRRVKQ